MLLKNGFLLLLFFATLLSTVIVAQPDTCGAAQKGEVLADFNGAHSYLSYKVDEQYMKETSLVYQDRFCTKNGSGIIAKITSNQQKEDILIEVHDGHVVVQLMQDSGVHPEECIFTLNKKVTDGSNYLIKVLFNGTKLTMTLFDRYTEIYSLTVANISNCLQGKFLTFTFLQKGGEKIGESLTEAKDEAFIATLLSGIKEKPQLFGDFDGCIGDSMLNGIPIDKVGKREEMHDIDPTCIHNFGLECTDICATTYIVAEGKKCSCPKESEIDKFGLCVQSCKCVACQNGGKCVLGSRNNVRCECSPGYEGKYCENKIDPCREFVCMNGGSCSAQSTGPSCACLPNFTGYKCEVYIPPEDPCEKAQCQNNASCVRNTTLEEKYFCFCVDGYHGKLCQYHDENKDTARASLKPEITIGLSVAAICILLGILAAVLACKKSRRNREEDKKADSNNADAGTENPEQSSINGS